MQVNLDETEVAALLAALDSYIPQLREEIGKTENYDMRAEMHAQNEALVKVMTKLGGSITDTNSPDIGASRPPWGGGGR